MRTPRTPIARWLAALEEAIAVDIAIEARAIAAEAIAHLNPQEASQ
ncbi:hypothetical protein ACFYE2_05745 [Kocuria sp. CPCC 205300]